MTFMQPRAVHALTVVALLLGCAATARTQTQPAGSGRGWIAVALEANAERQGCTSCPRATAGGLGGVVTGGVTLPHRLGVAVAARKFVEVNFEYSQQSRYILGLVQYNPAFSDALTINVGAGRGVHEGDALPYGNNGTTTVVAAGAGLRLPSASPVALTLTMDIVQAIAGNRATGTTTSTEPFRPRLYAVGVGVSFASSRSLLRATR